MCKGEGEVAFFSAKRWDHRYRADLIESATPCRDTQVVGPCRDSNLLRLTVLDAMSEDYTTAAQHLQCQRITPRRHYRNSCDHQIRKTFDYSKSFLDYYSNNNSNKDMRLV